MTIVLIADDDSLIGNLKCGPVDVLISCGDLFDAAILRAINHYRPRKTFAVHGNHDPNTPFPDGIVDLHLATVEFEGLHFGCFAGSWRYKPRGHHLFDQPEAADLLRNFPPVDIFVAHNSPAGIHERDTEVHQGFQAFLPYLDRTQPKIMIHGHQHLDATTLRGQTTILGVFGERLLHLR